MKKQILFLLLALLSLPSTTFSMKRTRQQFEEEGNSTPLPENKRRKITVGKIKKIEQNLLIAMLLKKIPLIQEINSNLLSIQKKLTQQIPDDEELKAASKKTKSMLEQIQLFLSQHNTPSQQDPRAQRPRVKPVSPSSPQNTTPVPLPQPRRAEPTSPRTKSSEIPPWGKKTKPARGQTSKGSSPFPIQVPTKKQRLEYFLQAEKTVYKISQQVQNIRRKTRALLENEYEQARIMQLRNEAFKLFEKIGNFIKSLRENDQTIRKQVESDSKRIKTIVLLWQTIISSKQDMPLEELQEEVVLKIAYNLRFYRHELEQGEYINPKKIYELIAKGIKLTVFHLLEAAWTTSIFEEILEIVKDKNINDRDLFETLASFKEDTHVRSEEAPRFILNYLKNCIQAVKNLSNRLRDSNDSKHAPIREALKEFYVERWCNLYMKIILETSPNEEIKKLKIKINDQILINLSGNRDARTAILPRFSTNYEEAINNFQWYLQKKPGKIIEPINIILPHLIQELMQQRGNSYFEELDSSFNAASIIATQAGTSRLLPGPSSQTETNEDYTNEQLKIVLQLPRTNTMREIKTIFVKKIVACLQEEEAPEDIIKMNLLEGSPFLHYLYGNLPANPTTKIIIKRILACINKRIIAKGWGHKIKELITTYRRQEVFLFSVYAIITKLLNDTRLSKEEIENCMSFIAENDMKLSSFLHEFRRIIKVKTIYDAAHYLINALRSESDENDQDRIQLEKYSNLIQLLQTYLNQQPRQKSRRNIEEEEEEGEVNYVPSLSYKEALKLLPGVVTAFLTDAPSPANQQITRMLNVFEEEDENLYDACKYFFRGGEARTFLNRLQHETDTNHQNLIQLLEKHLNPQPQRQTESLDQTSKTIVQNLINIIIKERNYGNNRMQTIQKNIMQKIVECIKSGDMKKGFMIRLKQELGATFDDDHEFIQFLHKNLTTNQQIRAIIQDSLSYITSNEDTNLLGMIHDYHNQERCIFKIYHMIGSILTNGNLSTEEEVDDLVISTISIDYKLNRFFYSFIEQLKRGEKTIYEAAPSLLKELGGNEDDEERIKEYPILIRGLKKYLRQQSHQQRRQQGQASESTQYSLSAPPAPQPGERIMVREGLCTKKAQKEVNYHDLHAKFKTCISQTPDDSILTPEEKREREATSEDFATILLQKPSNQKQDDIKQWMINELNWIVCQQKHLENEEEDRLLMQSITATQLACGAHTTGLKRFGAFLNHCPPHKIPVLHIPYKTILRQVLKKMYSLLILRDIRLEQKGRIKEAVSRYKQHTTKPAPLSHEDAHKLLLDLVDTLLIKQKRPSSRPENQAMSIRNFFSENDKAFFELCDEFFDSIKTPGGNIRLAAQTFLNRLSETNEAQYQNLRELLKKYLTLPPKQQARGHDRGQTKTNLPVKPSNVPRTKVPEIKDTEYPPPPYIRKSSKQANNSRRVRGNKRSHYRDD